MTISLKADTYSWLDGTKTAKSITWEIRLAKPNIVANSFTYTGSPIYVCGYTSDSTNSAQTSNYTNFYNISNVGNYIKTTGSVSATNVGTYKFVFYLNSADYRWTDGTTAPVTITWSITPQSIAKPTVSTSTFTYDGTAKTMTFTGFDNNTMQVLNGSATLPGTHKVTVMLKDPSNYVWNGNPSSNAPYTEDLVINSQYSITINVSYDSSCDVGARAFAKIERTNSSYVAQSTVSEIELVGELNNPYTFAMLNDGFYKISVYTVTTNHLATIASIVYNTSTYIMNLEVLVTKNNYGAFYSSSSSQNALASMSYMSPIATSYMSFAEGICNSKIGEFEYANVPSASNKLLFVAITLAFILNISICLVVVSKHKKKIGKSKGGSK